MYGLKFNTLHDNVDCTIWTDIKMVIFAKILFRHINWKEVLYALNVQINLIR